MKKILLPVLIFALFFFTGCGSSKKDGTAGINDSDYDSDDDDISETDENGDDESDTDDNGGHDADTDDDTDPVAGDPCSKNPCKDIPNSTGTCFNSTAGRYICECGENFWWWGERRGCTAQKPALANICTGMYSCSNNGGDIECPAGEDEIFYGQDAQYAADGKCEQQSLELKTVSDETIVIDKNIELQWQQTISKKAYTWNDALAYCENLEYAGFSDWRLPNKNELASIINYDLEDDSWPLDMPSDYGFWTSTTFFSSSMTNDLAIVIEIDGKQGYMPKHNEFYHHPYHVRCVR